MGPCLSPCTVGSALVSGEQVSPAVERTRQPQPVALMLNLSKMSSVGSAPHMVFSKANSPLLHTSVSQQRQKMSLRPVQLQRKTLTQRKKKGKKFKLTAQTPSLTLKENVPVEPKADMT